MAQKENSKAEQGKKQDIKKYQYLFEMDGILLYPFYVASPDDLYQKKIYEEAFSNDFIVQHIRGMMTQDECDVSIISTYLTEEIKEWKKAKIKKLVPECKNIYLLPYEKESKTKYLKEDKKQILIDTSFRVLTEWRDKGGLALQAINANVNQEIWNGPTINLFGGFTAERICNLALLDRKKLQEVQKQAISELEQKRIETEIWKA